MIKWLKNIGLVAGFAFCVPLAQAQGPQKSDSMFGLPAVSAKPEDAAVVGLPQSTQWISERKDSFLYLSYNATQMASPTLSTQPYVSDFGSTGFAYPGLDFFSRITALANPESPSFWRNISLMGRYSLGMAVRKGKVSDTQTPIDSSVESNSLLIFSSRIGALLAFEPWSWFRPYAGFEISPYFFRNTAGISGAELQGGAYTYGPVLGSHFPLFFDGKMTLMAEARRISPNNTAGQLFGKASSYTAGLGVTF